MVKAFLCETLVASWDSTRLYLLSYCSEYPTDVWRGKANIFCGLVKTGCGFMMKCW